MGEAIRARLQLVILREVVTPTSIAEGDHFDGWSATARRECCLPCSRKTEAEAAASRMERRARLRVAPQVVGPNPLPALSSLSPPDLEGGEGGIMQLALDPHLLGQVKS